MRMEQEIYPYFPAEILTLVKGVERDFADSIAEFRLRAGRPLLIVSSKGEFFLSVQGGLTRLLQEAYYCRKAELDWMLSAMSKHSIYALEQEFKSGYLTLEGGHRVGMAGKAMVEADELKSIQEIGSLNIRIAREAKGCADKVMPYVREAGSLLNVLVIAPPRAGKTTLLRDIARQLSDGGDKNRGVAVGIVDERSEIAACVRGCPTVDVGLRSDVMDACPKDEGILMMIRTMAPEVVVTDELGRNKDVVALREALHAGVCIIASVHGASVEDARERPYIGELIRQKYFDRYIVLSAKPKVGTVREILDVKSGVCLFAGEGGAKRCG